MATLHSTPSAPRALQQECVLHFPLGLLGFERIKRYQIVSDPQEAPFSWMQVIGRTRLAFLVVSPFLAIPNYLPSVSAEDAAFLELQSPDDAGLYGIVTLKSGGQATINLKGPIVFNRHTLRAKQVILTNASEYSLQHPLPTANSSDVH